MVAHSKRAFHERLIGMLKRTAEVGLTGMPPSSDELGGSARGTTG